MPTIVGVVALLIGAGIGASGKNSAKNTADSQAKAVPTVTVTATVSSSSPAESGPTVTATVTEAVTQTATVTAAPAVAPTTPAAPAGAATSGIGAGTYQVGVDIAPGTYKTTGADSSNPMGCYWARLSSLADTSAILSNNLSTGPMTVQILPTDKAFETEGCADWHRTAP